MLDFYYVTKNFFLSKTATLFTFRSASYKMNEFKQELFEKAGIGIPHEDIECNDVCIFG